jgi:pimeloyl-ACP methyl ester carboxylesterase
VPGHVAHRRIDVAGVDIFYREAGPEDAPVVLLPHGYPCSSYEFRNYMPALADQWHLLAPDFPGCGLSATPDDFAYDFDGYARFLADFLDAKGVARCALYLHDFGSQIGLRFAIAAPDRIAALIIQNGDIYEDELGPKYKPLQEHWANPTAASRATLLKAVSEEGFCDEFLNDVRPELAERISPDLWKLHWALMTPRRCEIALAVIEGLKQNLEWFPRYQAYLRDNRPPTLILWGPQDGYMPAGAGRAFLRDLPEAELHMLDAGHWALETSLDEMVALSRDFLTRHWPWRAVSAARRAL